MVIKRDIKKTILLFIILTLLFISGCYDSIEVDDMAYVVSIGFDKGINGNLRMTLLFAVPVAVGVGVEIGEIGESTTIFTVEAPTIFGGMNIANTVLSKRVNFSHAKLIIISSELAREGVEKYINAFIRFREFRPHMYLGISRGSAGEFLKNTKTILEVNPAKHFELLFESYEYTGLLPNSRLEDFYTKMECTCDQPVAALLDVSRLEDTNDLQADLSAAKTTDRDIVMEGDYKAGEIPVVFDTKINSMGMAVFKADRMVGELNGRETLLYLIVTGNLVNAVYSLPDPEKKTSASGIFQDKTEKINYISIRLSQARKPFITVKMKQDIPSISLHVSLEGDILSVDSDTDYSTGEELAQLEEYMSGYLEKDILEFMEKTRDVFNSDICATGKSIKKTFLLWDDWINFRWMDKYEKSEFQVYAKVSIRRSGITIKQIPVQHLKGEAK